MKRHFPFYSEPYVQYGVERKYQAQSECNAYNGFHLISIQMNEANQIKRFHVLFFLVKLSWDNSMRFNNIMEFKCILLL